LSASNAAERLMEPAFGEPDKGRKNVGAQAFARLHQGHDRETILPSIQAGVGGR